MNTIMPGGAGGLRASGAPGGGAAFARVHVDISLGRGSFVQLQSGLDWNAGGKDLKDVEVGACAKKEPHHVFG